MLGQLFCCDKTPWLKQVAGIRNWELTCSMASRKQTESWKWYKAFNLKSPPQLHTFSSKAAPPKLPQTELSSGDQMLKYLRILRTIFIQPLHPFTLFSIMFYFMNKRWVMYTETPDFALITWKAYLSFEDGKNLWYLAYRTINMQSKKWNGFFSVPFWKIIHK